MTQPESLTVARDGLPARLTGPWVHDKKYYLERYLNIFTRGIGPKWKGKLSYVDLFAGPGRSVIRDSGEEVEGSPFVALGCDFARYVFVDMPAVIETVKQRLSDHPKLSQIVFVPGDCNMVVDAVRAASMADHLTVAFIDPPGLQIRFATIESLVHARKVDLLMTIQFGMGIRMNLRQYWQSDGETLTGFLGGNSWREDVERGGTPSQIGQRILDRYNQQLRDLGYGTVQDREIPVRSDQNNLLLYFIVFASRHPRGQEFWRKITEIQSSGQRLLGY